MCAEQIIARPVHSCRPDDRLADADNPQAAAERASTAERPEITPHDVGMAFAEISCPLHRQLGA